MQDPNNTPAENGDTTVDPLINNAELFDVTDPAVGIYEHMPLLDIYMESLSSSLSKRYSDYLRTPMKVESLKPAIGKYDPVSRNQEHPLFDRMFRIASLQGTIAVATHSELIFRLVDIFFGGTGEFSDQQATNHISSAESNMLDKISVEFVQAVLALLKDRVHSEDELILEEWSPQSAAIVGKSESMVAIKFKIALGESESEIEAWFSLSILELLLGVKLLPHKDGSVAEPLWTSKLKNRVLDSKLELKCTLAEQTIPLRRVSQLKAGDFIPLSVIEEATFFVDKKQIFRAKVGVSNERTSAEFLSWL